MMNSLIWYYSIALLFMFQIFTSVVWLKHITFLCVGNISTTYSDKFWSFWTLDCCPLHIYARLVEKCYAGNIKNCLVITVTIGNVNAINGLLICNQQNDWYFCISHSWRLMTGPGIYVRACWAQNAFLYHILPGCRTELPQKLSTQTLLDYTNMIWTKKLLVPVAICDNSPPTPAGSSEPGTVCQTYWNGNEIHVVWMCGYIYDVPITLYPSASPSLWCVSDNIYSNKHIQI